jgi:hypothetical protein
MRYVPSSNTATATTRFMFVTLHSGRSIFILNGQADAACGRMIVPQSTEGMVHMRISIKTLAVGMVHMRISIKTLAVGMVHMRISIKTLAVGMVIGGVLGGTALAATGDLWQGAGQISVGGTDTVVGDVNVYPKTISFTLKNQTHTTESGYTLVASGRLFGDAEFTGANGQQVTQAFGFTSTSVAMKNSTSKTVCSSGKLIAGGRWDGTAYGELTFPSPCTVFHGRQYVEFRTRVDGTSTDDVFMTQR